MLGQVRGNSLATQQSAAERDPKQVLQKMHQRIKSYIDSDTPPDSSFGRLDFEAMPHLVKWANSNYPGLALHYAATPYELVEKLKALILRGDSSARFVGNFASDQMHLCAFEYKLTKGRHSLIGLEPGNSNNIGPAMMVFRIQSALQEHLPEAKFTMLEVNQQSSAYDCGLFSLDYAVKIHKSAAAFEQLHDRNVNDTIMGKNDFDTVPHQEVDKVLPPIFMKHIQSSKRLAEVLEARPELKSDAINKQSETLQRRVQRHTDELEQSPTEGKPRNQSILHQREKYVRKAMGL